MFNSSRTFMVIAFVCAACLMTQMSHTEAAPNPFKCGSCSCLEAIGWRTNTMGGFPPVAWPTDIGTVVRDGVRGYKKTKSARNSVVANRIIAENGTAVEAGDDILYTLNVRNGTVACPLPYIGDSIELTGYDLPALVPPPLFFTKVATCVGPGTP